MSTLPTTTELSERVRRILAACGADVPTGELTARTPITGGSLGAAGSPSDVDRAVEIATKAFRTWRTTYRCVAGQAAAVFVGAFDRARRLEQGLALRGYTGSLRVQVDERPLSVPFVVASAGLVGAVVTVTLVLA